MRIVSIIISVAVVFTVSELTAQGISRSNGIGVRVSFWNMSDHTLSDGVSGDGQTARVDLNGVLRPRKSGGVSP